MITTEQLIRKYKELEEEIIKRLISNIEKRNVNLERILLDVASILYAGRSDFLIWSHTEMSKAYLKGLLEIEKKIQKRIQKKIQDKKTDKKLMKKIKEIMKRIAKHGEVNVGEFIATNFGQIHIEAVNNLIARGMEYITTAEQNVIRVIKGEVGEYLNKKALAEILKKEVGIQALMDTKEEIIRMLEEKGITAIKTIDGKRLRLSFYAETIIRTTEVEAQNRAVINRGVEVGITKYRRIEHQDCCEICQPHNGEIWDIEKKGVPPLIYHPNCRGTWEAIVE